MGQEHLDFFRAVNDVRGIMRLASLRPTRHHGGWRRRARACVATQVAVIVLACAAPALAAQSELIEARVHGVLRTAGGGAERASFEVSAGGVTWQVEVSSDPQIAKRAAQLDGAAVIITGTYAERRVDSRTRRILSARTLEPASGAEASRASIEVTVRGTLRTGMVAIGGETTGTTITSGGVTWELELAEHQREIARRSSGKPATVTGRLTEVRGVEIPKRLVLRVARIEER